MLEFEEEALGQIALAVERAVTMGLWRCCSGRDRRGGALSGDGITQRFGIVALVAKHLPGRQIFDQSFGLRDAAGLPRRENKPHRVTRRAGGRMDFVLKPPRERPGARASDPPFMPAAC